MLGPSLPPLLSTLLHSSPLLSSPLFPHFPSLSSPPLPFPFPFLPFPFLPFPPLPFPSLPFLPAGLAGQSMPSQPLGLLLPANSDRLVVPDWRAGWAQKQGAVIG